jgi:glycosyltransferase involved in cell wall biosynthesis
LTYAPARKDVDGWLDVQKYVACQVSAWRGFADVPEVDVSAPSLKIRRSLLRSFMVRTLAGPRLAAIRKRVPLSLRQWILGMLERPVRQGLGFCRTSDWQQPMASLASVKVVHEGAQSGTSVRGINLYGYLSRWLGLGECARLYANAMLASGYPVALHDVDIDIPHARLDQTLASHMGAVSSFTRDLIFVNPDHWEDTLLSIGNPKGRERYVIGYWFWELENFPEDWCRAIDQVDEIMVSSAFVEQAVRRVCSKPVTRVPLPLVLGSDSGLQRRHFGLREGDYVFFCSFDFNSTVFRKNPHAVIAAFRHAFPSGDEKVTLLIKSSNGDRHAESLMQLLDVAAHDRRILVRDDMLERHDLQALHRCIDVYVSLHRCEGFGLGMAEAMCIGKPVVATAYSGNMEFMTTANSCLVDYRMIAVRHGEYPHAEGQQWADPDPRHAARHMRSLYQDRELASCLGAQAARDMARNFSVEACMNVLAQRLHLLDCELLGSA